MARLRSKADDIVVSEAPDVAAETDQPAISPQVLAEIEAGRAALRRAQEAIQAETAPVAAPE